jgi:hypothetical protein
MLFPIVNHGPGWYNELGHDGSNGKLLRADGLARHGDWFAYPVSHPYSINSSSRRRLER